jgi:hypothetical protein
MIIFAILGSLAAIGVLCWLLFTLAVFALPAFIGVSAGIWAHQTGAGFVGAIVIGAVVAGVAPGVGQLLLTVLRPTWLKLLVALAFVAPAAIAGFHATHGIVKGSVATFQGGWVGAADRHRQAAAPKRAATKALRASMSLAGMVTICSLQTIAMTS